MTVPTLLGCHTRGLTETRTQTLPHSNTASGQADHQQRILHEVLGLSEVTVRKVKNDYVHQSWARREGQWENTPHMPSYLSLGG